MAAPQGFEAFVAEASPSLFRAAWVLTRDAQAAEDLLQETFARMYVSWRDRRPIDQPVAYARRTLVHLHIDRGRRRWRSEVVTDDLPDAPRGDHAPLGDRVVDEVALAEALARLEPADRVVLVLRYLLDLSVADVAHTLEISDNAVRTRSHRASARLRDLLGEDFRPTPAPTPLSQRST